MSEHAHHHFTPSLRDTPTTTVDNSKQTITPPPDSSDDDDEEFDEFYNSDHSKETNAKLVLKNEKLEKRNGRRTVTTTATRTQSALSDRSHQLTDSGLVFLSYRVPYLNIHAFAVITHLAELLAIIVCLLSLADMGISQVPGAWVPAAITAYAFVYLLCLMTVGLAKPKISDRTTTPVQHHQIISEEYMRQLKYAERDLLYFSRAFAMNAIIAIFWWSWFGVILKSNPSIDCTTWPSACATGRHYTQYYLFIATWLFFNHIFSNSLESNMNIIGLSVRIIKKLAKKAV